MTGYVADLSWKSGVRAIEKLDRLRSTMAVNVLRQVSLSWHKPKHKMYAVMFVLRSVSTKFTSLWINLSEQFTKKIL